MQVIGALLVIWGIADFALSWNEIDLYYEIGINVPADIYPYTAWVAVVAKILNTFGRLKLGKTSFIRSEKRC